MDDTNSLIKQRREKLDALRSKGIDPFKNKFTPTESCADARNNYAEGREVAVAGRITAHRTMGKSMFIDVRDQSGRIQVYAQKNVLGDEQWEIFKHLDLGDFVGIRGALFTTKTGEISIKLGSGAGVPPVGSEDKNETHRQDARATTPFVILAKALRPPPEKWHGLADTEIRYRQRYLDLMANPDVKDVLLKRSEIIREIRNFLHARGYVEVETPMMQAIPGGAAAQPFVTHHNALGCDFYLRIALELYLKRLLVGGVDKVFEIGRNFRNEGLSRKHNPEFTMLEAYQAFGDYESMMELVESMIVHVAKTIRKDKTESLKIRHPRKTEIQNEIVRLQKVIEERNQLDMPMAYALQLRLGDLNSMDEAEAIDKTVEELRKYLPETDLMPLTNLKLPKFIDLTPNWKRAKYKDLIREKAGADWFEVSPEVRRQRAYDLGAEIGKEYEDFEVTGAVFEKLIEPTLIQPTFVTHLPKELVPLAKLSPEDPTTVEVFECCINGQEISPGYTEQNDPIEQRERLEHQAGGEQQKLDEDFLVALEHGMPPAGGIGIGIDRLCMMLLGQESIRDVILFPQLKPK